MEPIAGKKVRIFRGEAKILALLDECRKSSLSIKAFCIANNIPSASFHNWRRRYGKAAVIVKKQAGFATLQITTTPELAASLFAEINGIRIYQPVAAAYLKELLA